MMGVAIVIRICVSHIKNQTTSADNGVGGYKKLFIEKRYIKMK